ncbi:MAG TPA: hypothetical protein VGQ12_07510 [Candidatus Angelobacter sp.]|nr:hypothetical protein [Candidatus Angelobacter sp.]
MPETDQLSLIDPLAPAEEKLTAWALIELFGHQRVVGKMTVDPPEFPGMVRVDVPDLLKDKKVVRKGFTRYLGRASIYGVTPIDEETVRDLLPSVDGTPARPLGLRSYSRNEEDY